MWLENFYHSAVNQLSLFRITDAIDIILVSFLVYKALQFIRDTRTVQLLKGVALFVVLMQVSFFAKLNAVYYILSNVLQLGVIALIIVFQPELRRALEEVGRTNLNKWFSIGSDTVQEDVARMIHEISRGAQAMANDRIGALMVIEKHDNIDTLISSGVRVGAEVSSELIENIFVPNTPLHDGAVVFRNNKLELATCVLPVSQNPNIAQKLGTRHRAALGISEESDAIIVIVSEETGKISIAEGGELKIGFNEESLRKELTRRLSFETSEDTKRKLKFLKKGDKA